MQLLRGRTRRAQELAVSPDGRYLAASWFGCHVWDLHAPGQRPALLWGGDYVERPRFGGPSALVALVREAGGEQVWHHSELRDGSGVRLASPRLWSAHAAAFDPARGVLMAPSWHTRGELATVPVTPAGLGEPSRVSPCGEFVTLLGFTPAGDRYLSSVCELPTLARSHHLHDAATDECVATFEYPPEQPLFDDCWQFTPDGRRAYAATFGRLLAYDCAAGGPPATAVALPEGCRLRALAAHPGGRILATVEDDRAVTLRDADTLGVTRTYDFGLPTLMAVAFTPDGTRCAVGNSKGKVLLFDVDE